VNILGQVRECPLLSEAGIAVRMTRNVSQRTIISAAMGGTGIIILVLALPSWLLFSLIGAGLVAGACFVFKRGA